MAKTIYQKKLKLHKLAHNIIKIKDELEKKRLRIQLKRQNTTLNNTIKMMAQPSKAKATI